MGFYSAIMIFFSRNILNHIRVWPTVRVSTSPPHPGLGKRVLSESTPSAASNGTSDGKFSSRCTKRTTHVMPTRPLRPSPMSARVAVETLGLCATLRLENVQPTTRFGRFCL